MAFNPASVAVQPIASLTPFLGGKFWIKARAVDKGDIRTWNKPNSTGKLFSCTFVDESASIRATFFNDAVDSFNPVIQNGQVYYIGGGSVKNANRRFNNVNNEYEVSFDQNAQIHVARDAASNIPMQRYNFVPVSTLAMKEENSPVDVLAVVTKVAPTAKIVTKAGAELTKREVTLADQTAAVDITFWNDEAVAFHYDIGAVLALKNVRVRHFNGVTLSNGRDSTCDPNPNIPDTQNLHRWFQTTGGASKSLSGQGRGEGEASGNSLGRRYFKHIESEGLGRGDKADFIIVRCVPTFIRTENVFYDACPTCNKKATGAPGGPLRCEKCNTDVNAPAPRYMCSIQCSDGVSTRWLTLFNEAGEKFWDISAADLKSESIADATAITRRAQQRLYKPFNATLRVKEERGQMGMEGAMGEDRTRVVVQRMEDFVFPSPGMHVECQNLIDSIAAYHI